MIGFLTAMKGEIARALPKHMTPDRMARVVMTALRTVPNLAVCTRESFAGCVMQLAQLGLEPNTPLGHAWLIPRRDGKKSQRAGRDIIECTIVIGYQGFLELGRRAGVNCFAHVVREGDEFVYELGLHPSLKHIPSGDADREKKKITHVYAVARTKEFADSPIFVVLSKAQVDARKDRSATAGKGFSPWQSDEEAMTLKTAVRALWRWMPKQIEQSTAEAIDNASETGTSQFAAFDPTVTAALQSQGLQVDEDDGDGAPQLVSDSQELRDAVEARSGSAAVQTSLVGE
jgi:recombination protein RecT